MANDIQLYKLDVKSLKVEIEDISKYIYLHFQNSDLLFKWDEDYTDQLNAYLKEVEKSGIAKEDIDTLRHKYIALIEDVVDDINENVHGSMNYEFEADLDDWEHLSDSVLSMQIISDLDETITNNGTEQVWSAHYSADADTGIIGRIVGTKKGVENAKENLLYANIADRFARDSGFRNSMGGQYTKYLSDYSVGTKCINEDFIIAKVECDLALNNGALNTLMQYSDILEIKFNTDDIKSVTKIEFAGDIEEIEFNNKFKDELRFGDIDFKNKGVPFTQNMQIKLHEALVNNIKNSDQVIEQLSSRIEDAYAETMNEIYRGKQKIARKLHLYKEDINTPDDVADYLAVAVRDELVNNIKITKDEFLTQIRNPCIAEIDEYLTEISSDNNNALNESELSEIDVYAWKVYVNLISENISTVENKIKSIITKYHKKYLDLITAKINEMPEQITATINKDDLTKLIHNVISYRYGGSNTDGSEQGYDYNTDKKKKEVDNIEAAEIVKRLSASSVKIDVSKSIHLLANEVISAYMDRASIYAQVEIKR